MNRLLRKVPFKRLGGAFLLWFAAFSASAALPAVGDSARVSLITCSPGPEVYARFGHTAVRVCDPGAGIDVVFNYGMFDFNTEHFYLKFIRGATDYRLAVYDFRYFLPEYEERGSTVWEQCLNLTPDERRRLVGLLMDNYRPENRVYRYNFVYDNCSTRPRDKLLESLDGRVEWRADSTALTYREWVGRYVGTDTWLKLGIDLIFGLEADRPASRWDSMFLPEVLMAEVAGAEVVTPAAAGGETRRPLVASERTPVAPASVAEAEQSGGPFRPVTAAWALLALGVLVGVAADLMSLSWRLKLYRALRTADRVLATLVFVAAGLVGCVIFFLDYLSLHPLVGGNVNILWLNPLLFYVAGAQWSPRLLRPVQVVGGLCAVMALAALLLYKVELCYANEAFAPLALLVLLKLIGRILPVDEE